MMTLGGCLNASRMLIGSLLEASSGLGRLGGLLAVNEGSWASWVLRGGLMRPLGILLGGSWVPVGDLLGPLGGLLEFHGGLLEPLGGLLE
eukprot:7486189-Pyramimonas_sp.AAC.1